MHADPEFLALLALGEHVGTDDERTHAHDCPQCAAELSGLQRVVTLGRRATEDPVLDTPGLQVWAKIHDEVAAMPPVDAGQPVRRSPLATVTAALDGLSRALGGRLSARAELEPVAASWAGASGTAEVSTDRHGRRLLQVTLRADPAVSGIRQAWLVHRDDPTLRQSLGMLDGPLGLWTVERSIDLAQYAILDISQQGVGETEHSGQTIMRGELTLAS